MTSEAQRPELVFISYSHKDAQWLERLLVHLSPLALEYRVKIWSDLAIEAGDPWRRKVDEALGSANIFVLLLSADFLASEFINTEEMPKLLRAAREGKAIVLPVVLRASRLPGVNDLPDYQSINDPDEPLELMKKGRQEAVFKKVAERVESLLTALDAPALPSPEAPARRHRPVPEGDCRWYAQSFRAHIKNQNSVIVLNYALVTAVVLIWLALVMAAFFFGQDLRIPRPLLAGGGIPCLMLAFYCMRRVIDIKLNVEKWEIMKGAFDSECSAWSPVEFERNIRRAEDLLRSALGRQDGRRDT